jgi:hypothetical protein
MINQVRSAEPIRTDPNPKKISESAKNSVKLVNKQSTWHSNQKCNGSRPLHVTVTTFKIARVYRHCNGVTLKSPYAYPPTPGP